MDRRDFLRSAIATAGGVLTGSRDDETNGPRKLDETDEMYEDAAQPRCEACRKLRKVREECLHQMLLPKEAASAAEMLLPPEGHDWSDDCVFQRLADKCEKDWTREDFEDMEYDIESQAGRHHVNTSLTFKAPVEEMQTTVTVSDAGGSE